VTPSPSAVDYFLEKLGYVLQEDELSELLRGDPDSLDVLIEMLRGDNLHGRRVACWGLASLRKAARPAIPALREALNDPSRLVRHDVALALKVIDPEESVPQEKADP